MNNSLPKYGLRVKYDEYTIKKGDTLYNIAKKYGTTVAELMDVNMLTTNTLYPGQVLLVPTSVATDYYFESYMTKENDTIDKISKNYGVTPSLIGEFNDFSKLKLVANQDIKIPLDNVYIVKNNDTVDSILNNTNRSAEQLLKANAAVWFKTGNRIYL